MTKMGNHLSLIALAYAARFELPVQVPGKLGKYGSDATFLQLLIRVRELVRKLIIGPSLAISQNQRRSEGLSKGAFGPNRPSY
jgi:hypothetical protein